MGSRGRGDGASDDSSVLVTVHRSPSFDGHVRREALATKQATQAELVPADDFLRQGRHGRSARSVSAAVYPDRRLEAEDVALEMMTKLMCVGHRPHIGAGAMEAVEKVVDRTEWSIDAVIDQQDERS